MKIIVWTLTAILAMSTIEARARVAPTGYTGFTVQYGIASWYGGAFRGRLMASGTPFNEYAMVAAHRTLPLGTRVEVTNLRNGRSVEVKIADRGPYVRGRAIDLSKAAAARLNFERRGVAPVKIRVLSTPHHQATPPNPSPTSWAESAE